MKANFGGRKFSYAAGHLHCAAADACLDNTQDILDMFNELPFFLAPLTPPPSNQAPAALAALAPLASLQELGEVIPSDDHGSNAGGQFGADSKLFINLINIFIIELYIMLFITYLLF